MTLDDWKPLFEEIMRKHEHIYANWNAVDAKVGIILGFAVVVLFQIVLSSDINGLAGVRPTSANLADFAIALFALAVVFLVAACVAGFWAFSLARIRETPSIEWVQDCVDGTMELEEVRAKVAWHLYQWYPHNEKTLRRKTQRFTATFYLFIAGVAFFIMHFIVMLIPNSPA